MSGKAYVLERDAGGEAHAWVVEDGGNRRELPLRLDLANHSPTGFEWGYGGSGPAQLALAILADAFGPGREQEALRHYQSFKETVLVRLPMRGGTIPHALVASALKRLGPRRERPLARLVARLRIPAALDPKHAEFERSMKLVENAKALPNCNGVAIATLDPSRVPVDLRPLLAVIITIQSRLHGGLLEIGARVLAGADREEVAEQLSQLAEAAQEVVNQELAEFLLERWPEPATEEVTN